jgi:hypothetical protein
MLVPILTDGNCFFRAIVAFLNNDIKNANRNENGRINNKYLREKETNFAKFLRYSCVNVIETEKNLYRCNDYYDDCLYKNIEDRINKMYNNKEYIGRLEMLVISSMYKIQLNIYVLHDDDYNLINTIGKNTYRQCNLLLNDRHYQLIVNSMSNKSIKRPDTPRYVFENDLPEIIINESQEVINESKEVINESEVPKVHPLSLPPTPVSSLESPPISLRPKSFNFSLNTYSSDESFVNDEEIVEKEAISPEIKSYIDTQMSLAKIELLDLILANETNLNTKMYEQIELSATISKNLQQLIENIYKNN